MASNITNVVSTISVDEVQKVVISEKVEMINSGVTRTIRIYGMPAGVEGDPVLVIQLKALEPDKISIHAPETSF